MTEGFKQGYRHALRQAVKTLREEGHDSDCAACNGCGCGSGPHEGECAGAACATCKGWGSPVVAALEAMRDDAPDADPYGEQVAPLQANFGHAAGDGAFVARAAAGLTGASMHATVMWSLANVAFALSAAPEVFASPRVLAWMSQVLRTWDAYRKRHEPATDPGPANLEN